jgi:transcription elongation factor GreB
VSKAFTDEEAAEPPPVVAPRPPLPEGVPNYVSERGLALLRDELASLHAVRRGAERELTGVELARSLAALAQRQAELEARIASAEVVPLPAEPQASVRFGATVSVEGREGVRRHQIVGVDEADPARGRIAFVSPLARALLGRGVGDAVRFRAPRGEEELTIVAVEYGAEPGDGPAAG